MAVSVEQLMAAIKSVESGGDYRVINSIGAVGAYQVMTANIASWTREALGRVLSREQFRNSPSAQDTVARHFLGKSMKKHGSWQAAAAVWFSGQPNWNSSASDGGNTVRQYVAKVEKALAKVGSGGGSSSPSPTAPALPSVRPATVTAQQAGYQAEPKVGAFGAPTNPFKLPGWIASQGGGSAPGDGGAVQAGLLDGGGSVSMPWDGVSTVVLSSVFVLGGVALVVAGLFYAVSPAATAAASTAASITPAGKLATAAKAVS
ncbi:transglycosylase SLT domain-containing protein [Streptomyces sp. MBT57]|nr:transglycosylase SLT domain-containing protein [Streptomyces sp. MBT57]